MEDHEYQDNVNLHDMHNVILDNYDNFDDNIDIHGPCDWQSPATGTESGYGTASDTGSPIEEIPQPTFLTHHLEQEDEQPSSSQRIKRSPEEEQVRKYANQIYEVIYKKKNLEEMLGENNVDGEIIRAGKELHDMIEKDLKDKMESFVQKLKQDSTNLSSSTKQLYLKESFIQLMKKVAPKPSWRSYGHVLLCLGLIRKVAEDFEVEKNPQFESDIKAAYSNFVADNFTQFISSMGGFTDISDYLSHVKYYNETSFLGLATAAVGVVAAGMVWLTRG